MNTVSFRDTMKLLKADKKINSHKSYVVLRNYRIGHFFYMSHNRIVSKLMLCLLTIIREIKYSLYNIDAQIPYAAVLGSNIKLPHSASGVVVSAKTIIGDNATIFHQVTIGVNEARDTTDQKIIIGNNVLISAGAKIISCRVGNNCRIGANAVVVKDLPDNSLCYTESVDKCGYYDK